MGSFMNINRLKAKKKKKINRTRHVGSEGNYNTSLQEFKLNRNNYN